MEIIPIVHTFNHNYVLPAVVAFHTLLEHAKTPNVKYVLYVIGSDLTDDDRQLLISKVSEFANAEVRFLKVPELSLEVTSVVENAAWSSALSLDLFYKLSVCDLLSEHSRAIIADVDVIYEDDVAKTYAQLADDSDEYVAGGRDLAYAAWKGEGLFPKRKRWMKRYFKLYTEEERSKQSIGAGLMVFNLRKLREDGITQKWWCWAKENVKRLILPEQDIINQVCYPKIKTLPWNHMAIAPFRYLGEESVSKVMFSAPIQVHYATAKKPWLCPDVPMADKWFAACIRAGAFKLWKRCYSERLCESGRNKSLPLYWTNGRPNFGDSVTPELMEKLLGRRIVWASKWKTKALTIGSILGPTLLKDIKKGIGGLFDRLRMCLMARLKPRVIICGAGFLSDPFEAKKAKRRRTKVLALRGRLSAKILERLDESTENIRFGDPGILFDVLWPDIEWSGKGTGRRAYIPHECHWGTERFESFKAAHPELHYIDVRKAPREVFAEIATMSEIFSASLHGLIAADSLGIPNRWVDLELEGKDAAYRRFKFDDYYSAYAVKRDPIMLDEVPVAEIGEQIPRERVMDVKIGLLGVFAGLRKEI